VISPRPELAPVTTTRRPVWSGISAVVQALSTDFGIAVRLSERVVVGSG
jgi:hypothetical protein